MARKQLTDDELDEIIAQAAREYDALLMAYYDRICDEALMKEHLTPAKLTPSPNGKDCLGNGEHPGIECCCDECDHFLECFPDWKDHK